MYEIKFLRPEFLEALARTTLKNYDESLVSGFEAKEVPIEEFEIIGVGQINPYCNLQYENEIFITDFAIDLSIR